MSNPNVTIDRQKYVGGSDLPNILGFNATKYNKSVFEFAKEKAGIIPATFKGNEYTRYGQLMEPIIRDYINSKYGCNYRESTIIDKERGYRGNTDGIDENAEIPLIEIKTFGNELDDEYYDPQCQFYEETFKQPACRLVGYRRPVDFYTGVDYELEHDDSYFNLEFDENRIVEVIIYRNSDEWNGIEKVILRFKHSVEALKENPNMTEDEFNQIFYGADVISVSNKIVELEEKVTNAKLLEEELKKQKEKLYKLFDEKNIISFETDNVKFTKVAPTTYERVSIDTVNLQKDYKNIYDKYKIVKSVNKKGYILITTKKEDK